MDKMYLILFPWKFQKTKQDLQLFSLAHVFMIIASNLMLFGWKRVERRGHVVSEDFPEAAVERWVAWRVSGFQKFQWAQQGQLCRLDGQGLRGSGPADLKRRKVSSHMLMEGHYLQK